MNPLVSVIVPAFNAEEFIERTILSIQAQSYENLEIIIVDDGSTDDTKQIALEKGKDDPRITVLATSNHGVAAARNHGLSAAGGKFVAFVDADDLWHPKKIERQVAKLVLDGVQIGFASFVLYRTIDVDDCVIDNGLFWDVGEFNFSAHFALAPVGNGSSLLVDRKLALAVGGFESCYRDKNAGGCEDLDFELKIAACHPIKVVPEYLLGYRKYNWNMSSDRQRMARSMEMVVTTHLQEKPLISNYCKRLAKGKLYGYMMDNYMGRMDFRHAFHYMVKLLKNDPVLIFKYLFYLWPYLLILRANYKLNLLIGDGTKGLQHKPFFHEDPMNNIGPNGLDNIQKRRYNNLMLENYY